MESLRVRTQEEMQRSSQPHATEDRSTSSFPNDASDSENTHKTSRISLLVALFRLLLSIIVMMSFFPTWTSCMESKGSVAKSCEVTTLDSTDDRQVPICSTHPCLYGGCDITAYIIYEGETSASVLHPNTCSYRLKKDQNFTEAGCSVTVSHDCMCGYWGFCAVSIIGYAGIQLALAWYLTLHNWDPYSNLYNGVYYGMQSRGVSVFIGKWAIHPLMIFITVVEFLFVVDVFLMARSYNTADMSGLVTCDLGYYVDTFYPTSNPNQNTVYGPFVTMLIFELYKVNIFIAVQSWLNRNEKTEPRDIIEPLFRLDKAVWYAIVIAYQCLVLAFYCFLPWLFILYTPVNAEFVRCPTAEKNSQERDTTVTAPIYHDRRSSKVQLLRPSELSRQWHSKFRTSCLLALLKTVVALLLLLMVESDWRRCRQPAHDINQSCSISTANSGETVYCRAGCLDQEDCSANGTSVLSTNEESGIKTRCGYYGEHAEKTIYAECTAATNNKCACELWLIVTGTVIGINLLQLLIQVIYSSFGHFDPQKDVFNIIYGTNPFWKNLRFIFLPSNCLLAFVEVIEILAVTYFLVYTSFDVFTVTPTCVTGTSAKALDTSLHANDVLALVGKVLLFVVKEMYKINVYMSIQRIRERAGWKEALVPLLRFDVMLLHFVVMLLQFYAFLMYVLMPFWVFGWKCRVHIVSIKKKVADDEAENDSAL